MLSTTMRGALWTAAAGRRFAFIPPLGTTAGQKVALMRRNPKANTRPRTITVFSQQVDGKSKHVVVPRAPSSLTVIPSPDVLYRGEGSAFDFLRNAHADSSP